MAVWDAQFQFLQFSRSQFFCFLISGKLLHRMLQFPVRLSHIDLYDLFS